MFVHSGYFHLTFNILVQLLLGIPLEMVHRWWRVLLIYFCGGIAGSLLSSLTDGTVYIAGASGGVYALITAHLANVIFNWKEMEYPILRLLAFLLAMGIDIGVAIYYRYGVGVETKTAYAAHLGGAIVGLLLGIVILRNIRVRSWERVIWWLCLLAVLALFLVAIVWNAVNIGLYEGGSL
ncbi:RHBDL1_2_3 [Lepeophtheirus salmonis]|nr:RHBDL1_2_3 [Lepeophtheirus salmonis]CAF2904963.1 RHBDL1_2_3 [Lepeophtheirus salmonis]